MRPATHAFNFDMRSFESSYKHYGNYYNEKTDWRGGFGRLILGEKWIAYHGAHGQQSTLGIVATKSQNHPIFNGIIPGTIWVVTDVYAVRLPIPDNVIPSLLGQVTERNGPFDKENLFFGMRPSDSAPACIVKK